MLQASILFTRAHQFPTQTHMFTIVLTSHSDSWTENDHKYTREREREEKQQQCQQLFSFGHFHLRNCIEIMLMCFFLSFYALFPQAIGFCLFNSTLYVLFSSSCNTQRSDCVKIGDEIHRQYPENSYNDE